MGSFMANFKGQKAARLQSKGNYDEARKVYAEAYAAGMNDPRLLLAYSVLLIRAYEFEAAKELLVKLSKLHIRDLLTGLGGFSDAEVDDLLRRAQDQGN